MFGISAKKKNKTQIIRLLDDSCYKANDTAGYFVRLRETSVCMRLEEGGGGGGGGGWDTADADARAFGACDQHRWTDCQTVELLGALFIAVFI